MAFQHSLPSDIRGTQRCAAAITDKDLLILQVLPGLSGGAERQKCEYVSNGPRLREGLSVVRLSVFSGVQLSILPQCLLSRL